MGFELHRADIVERLMQPLPTIERLNELKDIPARPAPLRTAARWKGQDLPLDPGLDLGLEK